MSGHPNQPRRAKGKAPYVVLVISATMLSELQSGGVRAAGGAVAAGRSFADKPHVRTDRQAYPLPPAPKLPPAGGTFTDPTFGTQILRVTDEADGDSHNAYSYYPAFNRDSTMFFIHCKDGPRLYHFDPKAFRIARKLGSPIIDIVAPRARELKGPSYYLPRYFEVRDPKPGEKFHIDIAPGFDWDKVWETFVESVKGCLQRAKAHGLKFTVENHTHTMVPDPTAFLRLWDAIRDPALGMNLDVGWVALQREYPPVAVHKAGKHLMNVHMRDIDGLMRLFVHVGQGVMDFQAIAKALKAVRFQGFLNLEQDGLPGDMKATCARYLAMMKELLT